MVVMSGPLRASSWPSSDVAAVVVALDARAGQVEEHVVERGRAQGEVAHLAPRTPASATATGLIGGRARCRWR